MLSHNFTSKGAGLSQATWKETYLPKILVFFGVLGGMEATQRSCAWRCWGSAHVAVVHLLLDSQRAA
jgi:hypothetical protein